MRFLDLFSGTGSVSRVAESLDYTVISLDIVPSHSVDICQDIMTWDYSLYPIRAGTLRDYMGVPTV